MSDTVYLGTRKGLFTLRREGGGWRVADVDHLAVPVPMLLDDPRDGTLYAALDHGHFGVKLHRRPQGGAWEEVAAPAYPAPPDGDLEAAPSLKQIWALEAADPARPGSLWAGTIPGGLFRSDDGGESWALNRPLWERPERARWFGGGADDPGIHSVEVHPEDPRRVLVAVSCGGVWATEDGGETWEVRGRGMFAEYMPPESREDPAIQDPHRLVRCPGDPDTLWVQHHNGVFQSRDEGRSWVEVPDAAPSTFGFAVAVHPSRPETAWFVPAVKDECRVPVDGALVVSRTTDGGRSFTVAREGLPQEHAYDLVYRHALAVDGGGERLVLGSTTGAVFASEDGGDTWAAVSAHLPPVYCVRFGAA